jgi:thioredoxin 1
MSTSTILPIVTDATVGAELAPGTGLVALEFSAEWCGPCRLMTPILEAAAQDYGPALRIVQIDADTNPQSMTRFGVRSIPALLLFRDGALVDRIVGAVPKSVLRERLDRVIAGSQAATH